MKLPIDTSHTMIVAGTVEPVIDFDTKRQRADQNGEPLWSVELVSFCEGISSPTGAGGSRPPAPERERRGQGGPQAAAGRRVLKE